MICLQNYLNCLGHVQSFHGKHEYTSHDKTAALNFSLFSCRSALYCLPKQASLELRTSMRRLRPQRSVGRATQFQEQLQLLLYCYNCCPTSRASCPLIMSLLTGMLIILLVKCCTATTAHHLLQLLSDKGGLQLRLTSHTISSAAGRCSSAFFSAGDRLRLPSQLWRR